MSNPIVKVTEGQLSGKICNISDDKQYFAFKGIPYARPPLGELRFAPPEPPEPWEGVKDATKDCNICAQLDKETLQVVGDEDCLYLNVYTPSLPTSDSSLLPVMVFYHGGGFIFGSGTDDAVHGPDYLIEKDVVIVSLNYRLGVLGFLSLSCKEAPGNAGLKDQVQALKWVQKNIKNFNGDPKNVTIFGVSAGGASVEYLMLSPMTKGLFHKAIAQSGSSLLPWAQNNNIKDLASKIPIIKKKIITDDKDLLKFLRSMAFKDLVMSSMLLLATLKWQGGLHFGFVPTIEKEGDWEPFITKSTYDLLSHGEFNKVPYMTGFCTREGLLMLSPTYEAIIERLCKEKVFLDHLPFKIDDTQKVDMETKLKTIYLEGEKKYDEIDSYAIDFFSDVDFIGGIYVSTLLIAKNNSPVYFYEFSYDGGLNYLKKKMGIDRQGACHGDEGGYLIKTSILQDNLSDTDKFVKDRMCSMWTNFAKYGDPTPKIDNVITTIWEPIAETGLAYLFIDDKMSMKYEMYGERMKLFKELYEKYYKP
ncbi:juvenile hormone esterase-like [Melitaea cinxia]|uniref:juvenile hormone esterase-like n=1 Tax=Melitaea cinxia TaxID=113334 RepID=UPI001E27497A|nr:juvenile hormone esterase-like [Melitaea cinxia]